MHPLASSQIARQCATGGALCQCGANTIIAPLYRSAVSALRNNCVDRKAVPLEALAKRVLSFGSLYSKQVPNATAPTKDGKWQHAPEAKKCLIWVRFICTINKVSEAHNTKTQQSELNLAVNDRRF